MTHIAQKAGTRNSELQRAKESARVNKTDVAGLKAALVFGGPVKHLKRMVVFEGSRSPLNGK